MCIVAVINVDKFQVINPTEDWKYGTKMREYIANDFQLDLLWLFAVPVDGQNPPMPPSPNEEPNEPPRVPVGYWAGDRVFVIQFEHSSCVQTLLDAELVTELQQRFPNAATKVTENPHLIDFALENFEHVRLPLFYKYPLHGGDALFPADRVWVMRNLTERWYARVDALLKEEDRCGPAVSFRSRLGLGDLLYADLGGTATKVVTRPEARSTGLDGSMGQRVDVQPLDVVLNAVDAEEWVDLSEQAKECLKDMEMELDIAESRYD
ncbi:F-box domain-containing protein [Favolaschia claudopus]|uniref:F-box domain-containing protein n=1 Tax=Favolaschia claudopus TaxID=2862362 RepID=A0AAW0AYX1_9AGAR